MSTLGCNIYNGSYIEEESAEKFPPNDGVEQWTQTRGPDGSPMRP